MRHINFSTGVLSLLIALFSVVGLTAKHISDLFIDDHSKLEVAVLNVTTKGVHILAANTGNKAGAVLFAELDVYDGRIGNYPYQLSPVDDKYLVKGGEVKQLHLSPKNKLDIHQDYKNRIKERLHDYPEYKDSGFSVECVLSIWILQYNEINKAFDAQSAFTEKYKKMIGFKTDSNENAPVNAPDEEIVEYSVSCYDYFPWLMGQQEISIEAVE